MAEIESQVASTEFARAIRELAERVDDFEYDEALELLNALKKKFPAETLRRREGTGIK